MGIRAVNRLLICMDDAYRRIIFITVDTMGHVVVGVDVTKVLDILRLIDILIKKNRISRERLGDTKVPFYVLVDDGLPRNIIPNVAIGISDVLKTRHVEKAVRIDILRHGVVVRVVALVVDVTTSGYVDFYIVNEKARIQGSMDLADVVISSRIRNVQDVP